MSINCVIVAVPARLNSTRLPNKVLADIGGKPMLQLVMEKCQEAIGPDLVVLCTDNNKLKNSANQWGFPSLMTDPTCSSGTERIASVVDQLVSMVCGKNYLL